MKKKNFFTLLTGVIGGLIFSLGMCMCLIPEWDSFRPGVALAAIGGVLLITLLGIRLKTDGTKIVFNWKLIGKIVFGVAGALVMGTGMCLIMVWEMLFAGIIIGTIGISLLLCLIPICLGLKNE